MDSNAPSGFAERLKFALNTINVSPAGLCAAVAVDKSVVSRWLSGKTLPSAHNLARISAEIALRRPDFSVQTFEATPDEFLRALGLGGTAVAGGVQESVNALTLPYDTMRVSRNEVARRGVEYFGHYHMYYWSFTKPGRMVRMAMMLRPSGGLIEAHYGSRGFVFKGWALLLLNRLYVQFAEKRYEAMVFLVTNSGQQPSTRMLTGLLMGPSDLTMVPTVSPVILVRAGDLAGDGDRDDAIYAAAQDVDPFEAGETAPQEIIETLGRLAAATAGPSGGVALVQVPYVGPEEMWGE